MVVAARGDERRLVADARLLLEAEHVAPEGERAVEIGDLQVDVADVDAGVEDSWRERTLQRELALASWQLVRLGVSRSRSALRARLGLGRLGGARRGVRQRS